MPPQTCAICLDATELTPMPCCGRSGSQAAGGVTLCRYVPAAPQPWLRLGEIEIREIQGRRGRGLAIHNIQTYRGLLDRIMLQT